jgi:hypothetical protein
VGVSEIPDVLARIPPAGRDRLNVHEPPINSDLKFRAK